MERLIYESSSTAKPLQASGPVYRRPLIITAAVLATLLLMLWLSWDRFVLGNQEIEYFGRLIDQSGEQIPGAEVGLLLHIRKGVIAGPWNPPASVSEFHVTETDAQGRFCLRGVVGRKVSVGGAYKDGMTYSPTTFKEFDYGAFHRSVPDSLAKEHVVGVRPSGTTSGKDLRDAIRH